MISPSLYGDKKSEYPLLIAIFRDEGVEDLASDTVLGLFAQLSEKFKNKLDFIKQINLQSYIILIQSVDQLYQFIHKKINARMSHCLRPTQILPNNHCQIAIVLLILKL
jgi:tRNA A37 threonylcarbamoyladenosine synthetase subunit TsaC/SUA5/YrdC